MAPGHQRVKLRIRIRIRMILETYAFHRTRFDKRLEELDFGKRLAREDNRYMP